MLTGPVRSSWGPKVLGGQQRLRLWERRPTRPTLGAVGNRLTHDFTRPSSAWGFPEEDQVPGLTHGHPQALRGEGVGWHIQETIISTPSNPLTPWIQVLLLSLEGQAEPTVPLPGGKARQKVQPPPCFIELCWGEII